MLRAILFDLDGTLIDSLNAHISYFQDLLGENGYEIPAAEDVAKYFNLTPPGVIKNLLPSTSEERIQKMLFDSGEMYRRRGYFKNAELNPGLPDLLDILTGIYKLRLGIATSRGNSVYEVLEHVGIGEYFDAVITTRDCENTKPHPEPIEKALKALDVRADEAIYVGDSDTDVQAANAAGVTSIRFSDGDDSNANFNIKELVELLSILEEF